MKPRIVKKGTNTDGTNKYILQYIKKGQLLTKALNPSKLAKMEEFTNNNRKPNYMKWNIKLAEIDNGCRKCDEIKNLVVHHIDTNQNNNQLSNLITLCMRCHNLAHKLIKKGHSS